MWRICVAVFALLWLPMAGVAQEKKEPAQESPATAAEQFDQLVQEFSKARSEFFAQYNQAKSDEERQKLIQELYPRPEKYAEKFMELAAKNADDPVATKALTWVISNAGFTPSGQKAAQLLMDSLEKDPGSPSALDTLVQIVTQTRGPTADKAAQLLIEHHIGSEKLGQVCLGLIYSGSEGAQNLLRQVLEKSPHHEVQGQACLALGKLLMQRGGETGMREAEPLLERVVRDFADVKVRNRPLSQWAEGDLFEIRHLQVGMVAPNIEGEDVEGARFQLSDYRGKVVVLDFWGDW